VSSSPPGPWVERWLSAPRFQTYLTAAGGERTAAVELYEWNTTMSSVILDDLAHLEVAMRNVYNDALVARQPGPLHWTQDVRRYFPPTTTRAKNGTLVDLNDQPRKQIASAITAASGSTAPRGKVVAELMFGFWRYLTTSAHERQLWLPFLRHGFVSGTNRKQIDKPMGRLHMLRNRVAHHEPLLGENLSGRRADVLALLDRVSPDLRSYVASTSTWATIEAQRP